jgi:hypothetical protein
VRKSPARILLALIVVLAVWKTSCSRREQSKESAGPAPVQVPQDLVDGVALEIVFDTSGSMKDSVRDAAGGQTPKYVIAARALDNVVDKLEAYVHGGAPGLPRRLECGLVRFDGAKVRDVVALGRFDPASLRAFARDFKTPDGTTPLGRALDRAGRALLESKMLRKHVIVISDGENKSGPAPEQVFSDLKRLAQASGVAIGVHFVAFDVDAEIFADLERGGAGIFAAADEAELDRGLGTILEREVLLEVEDAPAPEPQEPARQGTPVR